MSDVIWPESSCSRKPASWRNRRHNGNRDWKVFFCAWAKAHEEKKLHDLWQIHRIYMHHASICYPMLYIYAILHSRSGLSFFGSTLERWTTPSVRSVRRPRSFDESEESAKESRKKPLLVALVASPLRSYATFHQGRRSQRHKTITYSYYIYIYLYLECVRMDILQVHIESHWVIECHIHE